MDEHERDALVAENARLRQQLRETEERAVVALHDAVRLVTDGQRIKEELEKTLVYREQMMGVLGHDLRNPLSVVIAIAGLARLDPNLPPIAARHVEQIDAAVRRMLEMIGTLLDFTHARFSGAIPISLAAMDLGEVAQRVADELAVARPASTVSLDVQGDLRGAWDAARISQVVSNLVGNAIAHGDGETVHVVVAGEPDDVTLRVHNTGRAIDPELLPSVFEPFRRGASGTSPPGLGLGLYIVQQIVQAHGGTVSVRSSAVEGTTFLVRLPRRR